MNPVGPLTGNHQLDCFVKVILSHQVRLGSTVGRRNPAPPFRNPIVIKY